MTISEVRMSEIDANPRVLLLDQDRATAATLMQAMERAGFSTTWAKSGAEGISLKASLRPHVVLMDMGMSDMSGAALLSRLSATCDCGVIVMSEMAEEADRIVGLELGADDYMVKPLGLREMVARIRAVHRRVTYSVEARATQAPQAASMLKIGPIQFNIPHRTVHTSDGLRIELTSAEFTALEALATAGGAPVSRDDLSKVALHRPWRAEDRSVDQIIFNLRRKLPADHDGSALIQSIRGTGYWLRKPDATPAATLSPVAAERMVKMAA